MSPFFANSAQHPRMSFGPPRQPPPQASELILMTSKQGNEFANQMEKILAMLKVNINNTNANSNDKPTGTVRQH